MKKNILWTILLFNLLAAGAFLAYVGMNPVEFRAIAPRMGEVIAFGTADAASKINVPAAMKSGAGTSQKKDAEGNKPPAKRPPRKGEEGGFPESDLPVAEARFAGPLSFPLSEQPPPLALYPFGVEKRTYPSADEMEVTILMRNFSGYYWEKANVVFKSADPSVVAQVFEVEDWTIDGYARFKYRFPKAELKPRMNKLRVRAIYGERSETMQSKMLNEERMALLGNLSDNPGAFYEAIGVADGKGGVLGVWAKATSVLQGDGSAPSGPAEFAIAIPDTHTRIASIPAPELEASTEERQQVLDRYNQFVAKASDLESQVYDLLEAVNKEGKDALASEDGQERIAAIIDSKEALDEIGLDLSLLIGRSSDSGLKVLSPGIGAVSESILELIETATAQLRYLDPAFSLDSGSPQ
ncbi:MAG: hypothetical protein PWP23_2892 [Candidatus Sumerlaeota bacterium]|nr:hypothetical protein [Candidatus Sumerlaeota bacterium]